MGHRDWKGGATYERPVEQTQRDWVIKDDSGLSQSEWDVGE